MPVTRILHGAANHRDQLHLAAHPAVDVLEGDFWVRSGRAIAHHDRPLGPLPLLAGWRGLTRRPRDPVTLDELLAMLPDGVGLMLDLRSWFRDPAPDLAGVLAGIDDHSSIILSCERWELTDRMRGWLPSLPAAYSLKSPRHLERFIEGRRRGTLPPVQVSIRHSLLGGKQDIEQLHDLGARVSAWTVDDIDRALELAEWGVDAVISNRLQVLNAV